MHLIFVKKKGKCGKFGEMGRWGDGEMGRWGDGEIGRDSICKRMLPDFRLESCFAIA
ncbi:MAG: hypothetical protein F6K56_25515 [Moorea sp. SIO3G5]|nr:hypothetical protein [Moorena sp. SIO3G5]